MKRRLSSLSTPFWKFIFPAFWIVSLVISVLRDLGTLLHISSDTISPFNGRAIGAYLFLVLGSVILYKVLGVLKRVDVDDDYLYLSNYLKEIKIPLLDVEHIAKPDGSSHQRIKIFLRSPSEFGDVIVFMPSLFSGKETWEELQTRLNASIQARHNNSLNRSAS